MDKATQRFAPGSSARTEEVTWAGVLDLRKTKAGLFTVSHSTVTFRWIRFE